ncbi:hypothetical protein DMH03_40225 [Amycolatopsis sp. WAC 01376]|nr:hypothetical protein DMH03_40225 [Amycolatopsis sp. WAC 01376]
MKVEFPRLSRGKGAFTRHLCDCWCLWGGRGDAESVKASLRDPESLKEAFTDRAWHQRGRNPRRYRRHP